MGCGATFIPLPKDQCMKIHIEGINKEELLKKIEKAKINFDDIDPEDAKNMKEENIAFCLDCGVIAIEGIDKHFGKKGHTIFLKKDGIVCKGCGHTFKEGELTTKTKELMAQIVPMMAMKFMEITMSMMTKLMH